MFHFYLGTLRYVQQYRNAGTNEAEDEGIVNVAIHYMKENMEKHLSLERDIDTKSDILRRTSPCCSKSKRDTVRLLTLIY